MPSSLDDLESLIRQEAEQKITVAKKLAHTRATLLTAREEFAATDAQNTAAFRAVLKQAREVGFSSRDLAALKLTDPDAPKPVRKTRTRKPPADVAPTEQVAHSAV